MWLSSISCHLFCRTRKSACDEISLFCCPMTSSSQQHRQNHHHQTDCRRMDYRQQEQQTHQPSRMHRRQTPSHRKQPRRTRRRLWQTDHRSHRTRRRQTAMLRPFSPSSLSSWALVVDRCLRLAAFRAAAAPTMLQVKQTHQSSSWRTGHQSRHCHRRQQHQTDRSSRMRPSSQSWQRSTNRTGRRSSVAARSLALIQLFSSV
mmetsp:Transcript_12062/g.20169  ORF Transcript_12062/g.20169 Transcript_12062/m.20169 type:complete len:203 (-) Transcript_12062:2220-2828(-)